MVLFINPALLSMRLGEYQRQDIQVNEDLFLTGPRTWNELADLVEKYTTRSGASITKSAIALGESQNITKTQDILAVLMMQNGAQMANPDSLTATFNLPSAKETEQKYYPGTEALKFYTSFSNPNTQVYTWNETMPNSIEAFRDGKVAMMLAYSGTAKQLEQENPNLHFRMLPLPQIEGATTAVDFAEYYTLTVPNSSPNQAAAWQFINYLQSTAISSYLAITDRPSPFIPQELPRTIHERIELSGAPYFETQTAVSWYRGKDPVKVENIFKDTIHKVTDEKVSFQNAIDLAAQQVTEVFRTREGFTTQPSQTPQLKTE